MGSFAGILFASDIKRSYWLQICRSYGARESFTRALYKYFAPNGASTHCNLPRAPLGAAYLKTNGLLQFFPLLHAKWRRGQGEEVLWSSSISDHFEHCRKVCQVINPSLSVRLANGLVTSSSVPRGGTMEDRPCPTSVRMDIQLGVEC